VPESSPPPPDAATNQDPDEAKIVEDLESGYIIELDGARWMVVGPVTVEGRDTVKVRAVGGSATRYIAAETPVRAVVAPDQHLGA